MIWPIVRFSSNILFNVRMNFLDICNVNTNIVMYNGFAVENFNYILILLGLLSGYV